jgi:hypothetical protein
VKRINAVDPDVLGQLPSVSPLIARQFRELNEDPSDIITDARELEAYGGAHFKDAIHIGLRASFPIWAGEILDETFPVWAGRMNDPDLKIGLVLPDDVQEEAAQPYMFRIGIEYIAGYLREGFRPGGPIGDLLRDGLPGQKRLQLAGEGRVPVQKSPWLHVSLAPGRIPGRRGRVKRRSSARGLPHDCMSHQEGLAPPTLCQGFHALHPFYGEPEVSERMRDTQNFLEMGIFFPGWISDVLRPSSLAQKAFDQPDYSPQAGPQREL